MQVIAQKDGIDYPLLRLHPDEFEDAVKKHPGLIGIPVYWIPGDDGPKVWPNPEEDVKIVIRD